MTKEELTSWALASGWKLIGGHLSLCKPRGPGDAIVRLVFKATVANVEIRKPSGKCSRKERRQDGGGHPLPLPRSETLRPRPPRLPSRAARAISHLQDAGCFLPG